MPHKRRLRNRAFNSTEIEGADISRTLQNMRQVLADCTQTLSRLEEVSRSSAGRSEGGNAGSAQDNEEDSDNFGRNTSSANARLDSISFTDIRQSLHEFSGENDYDVREWINELENCSVLMNWTDLEKVIFSKRLLVGTAKLALRSCSNLSTWTEIKAFLLDEFAAKFSSAEIHTKLSKRKQSRDESVREYFLRMRELAAHGKVEDDALMQYVVNGLSGQPSEKVLLYGATDIRDFRVKLENYTKFREHLTPSYRDNNKKNIKSIRCYNCGEIGHTTKKCESITRGPKCFGCQEFGHKKTNCPKVESRRHVQVNECVGGKLREGFVIAKVNGRSIHALVDTGSDVTILRSDEYVKLGEPDFSREVMKVTGIGSEQHETLGRFQCDVGIGSNTFRAIVHIMSDSLLSAPMILGKDILRGTQIELSEKGIEIKRMKDSFLECYNISQKGSDHLKVGCDKYRNAIEEIISNYRPVGDKKTNVQLNIVLKDETPISQNPRRLAPLEKIIVDQQIQEWLDKDIIQHSRSEFSSPIVLATKKDGSKRLCVDFRRLNKEIIRDRYPLPLIEDQIDSLKRAKVFTTLDLENGFFHVPVEPNSRKYTSFVTPSGQYEFLRMPFGLCTSPTVFQKFVNVIFKPLLKKGRVMIYMDDIVIPARDEAESMERLKEVLDVASSYGLQIKWQKCQFLCRQVEYLGYEITQGKVRPTQTKTRAVAKFPEPKNLKNIQQFLGLSGYFRKFIPDYATVAKPLSDLLRKGERFEFGQKQREAFIRLKNALISKPVLAIYDPELETELCTDASRDGYGAVLLQKSNDDMQFHPVYYFSRKTTPAESRYSSYELEALAIVSALKKLRVYLLGIHFTIITDCAAFKLTMNKKEISPRIAGWALTLQDYDFEIEHRPGRNMLHVDALSRNSVVMTIESDLLTRIKITQMKDERLKAIADLTKLGPYEDYLIEHEILYKMDNDGNKLLCVPSQLQNDIVRAVHCQGHFGTRKTEEIIRREYSIPKLRERIENVRLNCVPCILAERKQGKQEGLLSPIPKGEFPLSTYHLDHLGPLSPTKKGYRYILTIVDDFTKFVWLYPVKTLTTKDVLQKLEQQKATFGNPRRMITDRGTAFTSTAFESYCDKESIKHTLITTGVPRGNGQVERMHRIIIPVLTKLSIKDSERWFKYANDVQRFLNSTWQRSLSRSPFEVLTGVKMRTSEDPKLADIICEEIIRSFEEERDKIRDEAKRKILEVQEENKRNFNRRRKPARTYQVGDIVAIARTQFGTTLKILPKFLGPYQIIKVFPHNRYEVTKVGVHEGPKKTTTSADHMKPWPPLPGISFEVSEEEGELPDRDP